MARKRILVVEDDAAIRLGIVDALQFARYETLEAEHAGRAPGGREIVGQCRVQGDIPKTAVRIVGRKPAE